MGCCNSNIRQTRYTEVVVEERIIQTAERQLFFSSRPLTDLVSTIESLSNEDLLNLETLCDSFNIQLNSPSGAFLTNMSKKNYLSRGLLKNISILLSQADNHKKLELVLSRSHSYLIETVQDLLNISIDIIPQLLDGLEKSALLYAESLGPTAKQYVQYLEGLSVEQIKKQLEIMSVSSKDIRVKLYLDLESSRGNSVLDSKLERFKNGEEREKEEFRSCDEGQSEDLNAEKKVKNPDELSINSYKSKENELKSTDLVQLNDDNDLKISEKQHGDHEIKDQQPEELEIKIESNKILNEEYPEEEEEQQIEVDIEFKPEQNLIDIVVNTDLPDSEKISLSELTPATNLNDDFEVPKSPNDDLEYSKPSHIFSEATSDSGRPSDSPFELASDIPTLEKTSELETKLASSQIIQEKPEDPAPARPAPRKSSGLAAKLKAAQAFIKTKESGSPTLFSELGSPELQGISISKNDESYKRNSITSPKSILSNSSILRSSIDRNTN